ncbi:methionine ABC transporter ATP-binding protein [Alishewanella longhuensis]|uniref:Methionine ABC transporter ATP-binding protein n=1 Tax=Alishewanella longhuensis TaxID=1091037 RepID=A0ABQ3L1S8_9ALTE|nr:ATP-binding cassette domain-containing protein [Alishewanella longhuensis]GHG73925.1 methionine ABC transporter ATP-binding protein [Alishewanella longhuensis]
MTTKPKIPAIELKDVSFWYKPNSWQLQLPALALDHGQHLFIRGASGSGKTTLLNLLSGITKPNLGELWVQGQPLHQLSAAKRDKLRAAQIGVVFQQLNLIPYLSVLDNVLLRASFAGKPGIALQQRAAALLEALGLDALLWQQPASALSVGQQQRVAIARALLTEPALLIADEPTSALDADNRDAFMRVLLAEADKCGTTVIFVSHDQQLKQYFQYELQMANLAQGVMAC